MTRKLIILAVLCGLCVLAFATTSKPPICSACKQEIKQGEYLAAVQGEKTITHIHFRCALIRHLRTLKK